MVKFYAIVRFTKWNGEMEEFRIECMDWTKTKEECTNEFNANGYTVYATFTEEEFKLLEKDLNLDLSSKAV